MKIKSLLLFLSLISVSAFSQDKTIAYRNADNEFIGKFSSKENTAPLPPPSETFHFLKSYSLNIRWRTYMGEPLERYKFNWERSDGYTIKVDGIKRSIKSEDLKEYPDLLKRFEEIRPTRVDLKLYGTAGGRTKDELGAFSVGKITIPSEQTVNFVSYTYIVKDDDLLIGRSGYSRSQWVDSAPETWNEFLNWTGGFKSFNIPTNEFKRLPSEDQSKRIKDIKSIWKQINAIQMQGEIENIEWPELEMINIIKTYDRYKNKKKSKKTESDDDFWNGEDEKVTKKTENDDFWSGESKKNTTVDFWSGKGSTEEEVNVQKSIATATGNQYIGQKEVLTKRITISYYDHGEIDGDRINIKHNGKTKANNVTLRSYDENLSLDLEEGVNRISFEALNQGSAGQNTASFTVYDANKNVLYTNEWKINTGFKGTLLLIKL
ncbi:hypothetical protein [Cochleicola gelatinilyticus]|uniref:Uncharacterized protein n=1 Tax=Cochleicola gelatinilyticus TaxID=1763537 RepID=A0A167K6E0_9FLAO|nr:hypothetical protein [Cochleicola gelatinilyticus]OAB81435.1 hypothetical protein ULVI_01025 [Cochleicola gelatinilyticus]